MSDTKHEINEAEWRAKLSPDSYCVLREKATERPGTGKYYKHKEDGSYLCAGCGTALFDSATKYDSGSGWPAFWEAQDAAITEIRDTSLGMVRTEVVCAKCGGHLGHLFPDGYGTPTGMRYCINSLALDFKARQDS